MNNSLYLTTLLFTNLSLVALIDDIKIVTFINQTSHHSPQHLPSSLELYPNQPNTNSLIWSILIPTLVERRPQFIQLFTKILRQIEAQNLENRIEIIFFSDNREADVGFKRNQLLSAAKGKYTCFVDDDDDLDEEYIQLIYNKLLDDCDCVKLVGIYHHIDRDKRTFIHSIAYKGYFEKNQIYYRPPNHLNPIKREIALKVKFDDQSSYGEDTDWAMKICKAGLIKTESQIEKPYYFYNFDPKKSVSVQKLRQRNSSR